MKILIVRTFPDKLNLKSYNVQEVGLAKALVKKGHVCDIVLYNGRDKDREEEYCFSCAGKNYTFKIHWLRGYNMLKNGFMPSLKKIIPHYDVLQVHEYDQLMSRNLYIRQPRPAIIYHGPYYDPFARGYNLKCKVFDRLFLRRRRAEHIVAVAKSRLAADFLYSKGFRKVIMAGVGIDPDNFGEKAGQLNEEVVSGRKQHILYVGKLEERRNPYFLVEVFRKLQAKHPDLKLMIVGSGEPDYQEKFLTFINEEQKKGSILYRERAAQVELVEYYQTALFFLLASSYEIFGMVLLEAMYFGVPVISSVNGGSSTLVQNGINGFVMDRLDSAAWAECLNKAMENEELLESLGKNARKTIKERYTWDALAELFIEAYRQAMDRGEGRINEYRRTK